MSVYLWDVTVWTHQAAHLANHKVDATGTYLVIILAFGRFYDECAHKHMYRYNIHGCFIQVQIKFRL